MDPISLKNKKKMKNTLSIFSLVFILLLVRIGYLEFVKGEWLQTLAIEQQIQKRTVNAKRGKIFDSTNKYF